MFKNELCFWANPASRKGRLVALSTVHGTLFQSLLRIAFFSSILKVLNILYVTLSKEKTLCILLCHAEQKNIFFILSH
jgi:hypothetical protein